MNDDYLIRQHTTETELDLFLVNSAYHPGACVRDQQTSAPRKYDVQRVVLGTIRRDSRTGEIIEVKERK